MKREGERKHADAARTPTWKGDAQDLTSLLEALPVKALLVDEKGSLAAVSTLAARQFGWEQEELRGQPLEVLLPESLPELDAQRAAGSVRGKEFVARRRDGSELPVEVGLTPLLVGHRSYLLATLVNATARQAAERSLGESEHRFQQFIEAMPQLIWTCRMDGSYDFVNRRWAEYSGLSPGESLGKRWTETVHPEDRRRVGRVCRAAMRDGLEYEVKFRMRRHDGAYRWFDMRGVPLRDADGRIEKWLGSNTDVHEAHVWHEALREGQERLEGIMATAPGALVIARGTRDGCLETLFVSPRIRAVHGISPALVAADTMSVTTLMDPDDVDRVLAEWDEARAEVVPFRCEYRVVHPEDGRTWVECRANPVREPDGSVLWYALLLDVTERKRAEEELRTSRSELFAALEAGGMGIWRCDLEKGDVSMDATVEKLWGRSRDEIYACTTGSFEFIHPEDRDRVKAYHEALLRREPVGSIEYRILLPDGGIRWLASRARLERDASGRPRAMVGVEMDFTERKRAEEGWLRSQKLEALGTLAGGAAHDFNNLLLAILANTELALSGLPPGHPVLESLREIERGTHRAAEMVRQLLAFSRPHEPRREIVDLKPVVYEALQVARASLPQRIEMRIDFAPELPAVEADPRRVHQVVVSLVRNAEQAIGGRSGRVDVQLSAVEVGSEEAGACPDLQPGSYVCLSVRDDGCGMDRFTLERAFDPFFTTKEGEASGLGLSLVHGVVRAHGGGVTVESQPGQGAWFRLFLPVAALRPAEAPPEAEAATRRGAAHVLYVDNELALVTVTKRLLEGWGYRVTARTKAAEAVAEFRSHPEDFDVVVTDLSMPGMSGLTLARELISIRPGIPILVISGRMRPQDEEEGRRLGIRGTLHKPYAVRELAQALERVLPRAATAPEPVRG